MRVMGTALKLETGETTPKATNTASGDRSGAKESTTDVGGARAGTKRHKPGDTSANKDVVEDAARRVIRGVKVAVPSRTEPVASTPTNKSGPSAPTSTTRVPQTPANTKSGPSVPGSTLRVPETPANTAPTTRTKPVRQTKPEQPVLPTTTPTQVEPAPARRENAMTRANDEAGREIDAARQAYHDEDNLFVKPALAARISAEAYEGLVDVFYVAPMTMLVDGAADTAFKGWSALRSFLD